MSSCPSDEQLAACAAGGAAPDPHSSIGLHLAECTRCRKRVEEMRADAAWVDGVFEVARPGWHEQAAGKDEPTVLLKTARDKDVDPIEDLIRQGTLLAHADPGVAARLGHYKVIAYLGSGGMGVVLKGRDGRLKRTVALKILRPEVAHKRDALKRFEREAQAAAQLQHPNIVTVYSVEEDRGVHFLVMEYVDGITLAELIKRYGPLPTETIKEIFRQLLTGLAAAHSAKLIHRDIKSSNILLGPELQVPPDSAETRTEVAPSFPKERVEDRFTDHLTSHREHAIRTLRSAIHPGAPGQPAIVKVADFGLARMLDGQTRLTLTDSVMGTPEYMSPEQARGDENIDHCTDLYSAGVVLYEMLTGQTPFKAKTPSAAIHQILHNDPTDPRQIKVDASPHLASLALRLMAKRPKDRCGSAKQVIDLLNCQRKVRRPATIRKWLISTTIAMGMLLCVLPLLWLLAGRGPVQPPDAPRLVSAKRGVDLDPPLDSHLIEVLWDNPADPNILELFEKGTEVMDVVIVDLDERGRQAIIAGTKDPIDERGSVLRAVDASTQEELWSFPMHHPRRWPGCQTWNEWWNVRKIVDVDLDGDGAEEVLVAAVDPGEHPSRLSWIDPRGNGEIKTTFWHAGHITEVWEVRHYFADSRPAIVAIASSHEPTGFGAGLPPGECQLSRWTQVMALMVLDPQRMDGAWPRLAVSGAETCVPQAYAVLNAPYSRNSKRVTCDPVSGECTCSPRSTEPICRITDIEDAGNQLSTGDSAWFKVFIGVTLEDGTEMGPDEILVDRNLTLLALPPMADPSIHHPVDFWESRWQPIVQNGQLVDSAKLVCRAPNK